jgi:hypothetical protein
VKLNLAQPAFDKAFPTLWTVQGCASFMLAKFKDALDGDKDWFLTKYIFSFVTNGNIATNQHIDTVF